MGKYSERCEAEGIIFILLVVDRFGGGHKDSLEVITKLRRHTEVEAVSYTHLTLPTILLV